MSQELAVREWVVVFVLLLFLITLAAFSFSTKKGELAGSSSMISIQVIGAVAQEQQLLLPAGASVVDALARMSLSENADIGKLALNIKLQAGQLLVIPTRGKTTIFVTGAVEKKGLILIPEKCRYPDLIQHLSLQEDADLKQFKRKRRLLRDGEVVTILSKK